MQAEGKLDVRIPASNIELDQKSIGPMRAILTSMWSDMLVLDKYFRQKFEMKSGNDDY